MKKREKKNQTFISRSIATAAQGKEDQNGRKSAQHFRLIWFINLYGSHLISSAAKTTYSFRKST